MVSYNVKSRQVTCTACPSQCALPKQWCTTGRPVALWHGVALSGLPHLYATASGGIVIRVSACRRVGCKVCGSGGERSQVPQVLRQRRGLFMPATDSGASLHHTAGRVAGHGGAVAGLGWCTTGQGPH